MLTLLLSNTVLHDLLWVSVKWHVGLVKGGWHPY